MNVLYMYVYVSVLNKYILKAEKVITPYVNSRNIFGGRHTLLFTENKSLFTPLSHDSGWTTQPT